jgi:Domain of unknown function (DUF5063)
MASGQRSLRHITPSAGTFRCKRALCIADTLATGQAASPEPRADLQHDRVQERFASCANIVYSEVFDPFEDPPTAPVGGSLLDDLQDLYSDLKAGLVAYDAGYVRGAAWQWRFHFTIHWGEHATSAIRALYWYLRHGQ